MNLQGFKMSVSWKTTTWDANFGTVMSPQRFTSVYDFAQNGWINWCLKRNS